MNLALILLKTEPAHPLFDAVRKQRSQERSKSRKISRNSSKNLHGMRSEGQMPIWKNPVLEGQRYLNLHLSGDYPTYETIAKKFGVSRARICQMIALAKNLPDEITGLFSDSKYLTRLHHITERKLRPLTLMKSNSEKIKAFEKLRGSKTNTL